MKHPEPCPEPVEGFVEGRSEVRIEAYPELVEGGAGLR